MNFVDLQPKSFLDYAWTSPSTAAMNAAKASKTNRKQNRCCDQCRKGKRACDAAILEDTLLETDKSGGNTTLFHYSDNFGPLASCGNCEKTKKTCTFEWLRSQRMSQVQPRTSSTPPAKRRRTQSSSSGAAPVKQGATLLTQDVIPNSQSHAKMGGDLAVQPDPPELGVTFADFPCGTSSFYADPMTMFQSATSFSIDDFCVDLEAVVDYSPQMYAANNTVPPNGDSGEGSSLEASSESRTDIVEKEDPCVLPGDSAAGSPDVSGPVMRVGRKRRRRSPGPISNGALSYPAISFAGDITLSINNAHLTEGLLRIYHSTFENALACWLTERTCPYSARVDESVNSGASPSPHWDNIYHRVFRLDRFAASIRGRQLTFVEDKAASKALNLSIYAFASQWSQSSPRSRAKYPFRSHGTSRGDNISQAGQMEDGMDTVEFDRKLQISAWHEARNALQSAGEIESFRIVLAEIVFALTQKPVESIENSEEHGGGLDHDNRDLAPEVMKSEQEHTMSPKAEAQDVDECEDLLSKLDLAMNMDGPPVHLEKGLRLIHSLRSRMAMCAGKPRTKRGKQYRLPASGLQKTDRATVDLLFWLGVMFDTLSAAMHKRPLVVPDEDSDVILTEKRQGPKSTNHDRETSSIDRSHSHWDDYLFARQQRWLQDAPVRWPCSFDQAAAVLCDAAPVKVLLFRRVTRIQTLLARFADGEKIELSLRAALDVYDHWNTWYAPFIRDCIQDHDQLAPRIQSWYVCLAGHWHLAVLLLADLIEIVDNSALGTKEARQQREMSKFVAQFREKSCQVLSDVANCACPRDDTSFSSSRDFHFAVNQGALLTEPWNAVLIRAFAKAGVMLLESDTMLSSCLKPEDAFDRADNCVKALWYLGRKSDMALSAAQILGEALKERRKSVQEKVEAMSAFLESDLWEGLDDLNEAFGLDCDV